MKDEYFKNRAEEMKRFFTIKDFFCAHNRCLFTCSQFQKQSCFESYRMLALSDDKMEDILK